MRFRPLVVSAICSGLLLSQTAALAEAYGFAAFGGLMRKNVTVVRRLAPEVQLSNVSISIKFPNGSSCLDGARYISQLQSIIAQGGQNVFLDERNPMYDIRLNVVGCERPHVERKTEGKDTTYTRVGNASIVFQLIHHVDGQLVLSRTESYIVGQGDSPTPPKRGLLGIDINHNLGGQNTTDDQVAQELNEHLARRVASHLVVTPESVILPLAKGPDLDDADKLALALRWNEFLERLATLPPRPVPQDDAYRIYNMGVANEALGYASEDPKTTLKYLREASIDYSKALEAKPAERFFTTSQTRIEQALTRYSTLDERTREAKKMQQQDTDAANVTAARKKAGVIDNLDIIKLVQARVPFEIIITRIRTAPTADFDLTTDGLVELSRFGVNGELLSQMTERMTSPNKPLPPPPPRGR